MKILALDTSRKISEVTLYDTQIGSLHTEACLEKNNESLLLMIRKALQGSKTELKEIDAFAACIGPGSFTGLRIGITTVKTFAQMAGKPVYGVSAFAAMAKTAQFSGTVFIDARGGRVYFDSVEAGALIGSDGARTMQLTELLESGVEGPFLYLESESISQTLSDAAIEGIALPKDCKRTPVIARFAQELNESGAAGAWEKLQPEYVGVSQAERELEAKLCKR